MSNPLDNITITATTRVRDAAGNWVQQGKTQLSTGGNPAKGFDTSKALTGVVDKATNALAKKAAGQFASNGSPNAAGNLRAMTTMVGSGLQNAASQIATGAARGVSEKLNSVLGGKLSSALGAGVPGMEQLSSLATKNVSNLANGAVSKLSTLGQNKLSGAMTGALGKAAGGLLGGVLGGLQDSAAKNLAGAKLAPAFFESGPTDKSLVVDAYGVSDNNILNSVVDGAKGLFKDAVDSFRQSPDLLTDLTMMAVTGEQSWSMSKDNLINRVVSSIGGTTGVINNLTKGLRDNIVNGVGLPPEIFDTVVTVVDGEAKRFAAGDVNNARQVYSMCNQIVRHKDTSKFFDVGSESALMAGVMREAIALGMDDAVAVLVEKAPHDEVAYNALYANMRVSVEYSDLDSINLMLEKLGPTTFLAHVPDAVQVLLHNYELPVGTMDTNYDTEWAALQACLDTLRPGWGRVKRGDEEIIDLSFYASLSSDARKLMLRDPVHQTAALVGQAYGSRDLIQELQQNYPLLPLTA